jgi:hypothetical protein
MQKKTCETLREQKRERKREQEQTETLRCHELSSI